MKHKTKKILISSLVLLIILFICAYLNLPSKEVRSISSNINQTQENNKEEVVVSATKKNTSSSKTNTETKIIPEVTIKATVTVSGKNYEVSIPENKNIHDLMTMLMNNSKEDNFTFHAKEYGGMGHFVDMINGVYGTPGAYWVYYINNKKASVGISQYIIKDGDIIRWAQEGI